MFFRSGPSRKPLPAALLCLGLFFPSVFAASGQSEAEEILRAARVNPLGTPISLDARLRAGSSAVPFRIEVADGAVRYVFDNPPQILELRLGEQDSTLTESFPGKSAARPARNEQSVRGAGITREDLALKFLYWKNPKILGEESIRQRRAWKMEIQAPRGRSQYGVARLWIDKESGALLRVEGYDLNGRLVRRFEVVSAQKLDGQWMLKQMRIETFDPETRKITSRTYLEVLGKSDSSPS